MVRSKLSAFVVALILSLVYPIVIEITSIIFIQYDWMVHMHVWIAALAILYAIPICIFYRNKYWPFALIIIAIAPILSFAFLNVLGNLLQSKGENVVGNLGAYLLWGYQMVSFILGTLIGLVINANTVYFNRISK